ncbi:MAG: hypothetical protein M1828_002838 [Chrysothrix sp. TS-e1954]|nr:MAG: hypothetical protein M1828_002838 [Chrysothrix sp. TS-e1954]
MTRRTRAAQRAMEDLPDIHNDEDTTTSTLPTTNSNENDPLTAENQAKTDAKISLSVKSPSGRPALQEVAANCGEQIQELQRQFPPEKDSGTTKGKAGKKGKKGKKIDEIEQTQGVQVVEDENVAPPSPASDEAVKELSGGEEACTCNAPVVDESHATTTSPAARAARRQVSPSQPLRQSTRKTTAAASRSRSRKRPEIVRTDTSRSGAGKEESQARVEPEQSLVDRSIGSQVDMDAAQEKAVPLSKSSRHSEAVQKLESVFDKPPQESGNPAPLASIVMDKASPNAEVVEDPIEALDALEDAIEEVGSALPEIKKASSPLKNSPTKKPSEAPRGERPTATRAKPNAASTNATRRKSSMTIVPRETKASALRKNSGQAPAKPALGNVTNKPTAPSSTAHTVKRKPESPKPMSSTGDKRKSSIAALNTPPPAAKSKKLPTKSNFQLPGEAITAKLKAQKEDRQKRQEEQEAAKKREQVAKPAPKSRPVEVRATTASRARLSLMADSRNKNESSPTDATGSRASKRTSVINAAAPQGSRLSTASLAHRPKSTVVPSSETLALSTTMKRSRPSSTLISKSPSTVTTAQTRVPSGPKPSGKDIFNRDRQERETQQTSMKEKQEAARRARAAAAERGRQASREWAERMKVKKMKGAAAERETGPSSGEVDDKLPAGVQQQTMVQANSVGTVA